MPTPKLTLFLDIVSPFAYEAFYVIQNSPVFKQCDITYIPIFLGGVMKATGNRAPMYIKNKDKWINLERLRWAHQFKIPMTPNVPDGFPINTIGVMRALCAVAASHPEKLTQAFEAIYHAVWAEGKPAQKPEIWEGILEEVLGGEAARGVVEKATQKEAKDQLTKNTELALSEGAFGLPWFVATNAKGETEKYWGFDHLGQVVEHLGLERGSAPGFKALL